MNTSSSGDLLLGFDLGSSSVKVSLLAVDTGKVFNSVTYPTEEMPIVAPQAGWAEQDPTIWWENIIQATHALAREVDTSRIKAIGIAYQMHGLVMVDHDLEVLRPAIIWCDSRAVEIGNQAFEQLGTDFCLTHLLNSPGNFTASKLKWVQTYERNLYNQTFKVMLPGDFIAMKMTGEVTTTASGLSEGVLWDYPSNSIAQSLLNHYQIDQNLLPDLVPTFAVQGKLSPKAASELGIPAHIPIAYRAGDQPNNAFSLNVLQPGEVAATAGTSGVVYGITDRANYDVRSRVNTFLHVNHQVENPRYGVLLCVNGTGILNSWFKNNMTGISRMDYNQINDIVAKSPIGAEGLVILPFGNGAERILENKDIQSQIHGLNFNRHNQAHMFRAMQEGIVFALKYGFDIMQNMGLEINTVKAGHSNMFLSPIFREAFCNITGATVALYNTDGAQGAARGAGLGAGLYASSQEAFTGLQSLLTVEPEAHKQDQYQAAYARWLSVLKNYA